MACYCHLLMDKTGLMVFSAMFSGLVSCLILLHIFFINHFYMVILDERIGILE